MKKAMVERIGKLNVTNVFADTDFTYVCESIVSRQCKCAICNSTECEDEKLVSGEKRISAVSSSDVKHYHFSCYNKKVSAIDNDQEGTNYSANSTRTHTVSIVVNKYLVGAYLEDGFVVTKCLGNNRELSLLNQENRHSSGHILPTLWERGVKVKVNGEVVANWEEFDMVTR